MRKDRSGLIAILVLAFVLRLAGAWGKELWLDELHSALIAARPLADWWIPGSLGGYTPLYFLISAPFSRFGGDFAARLPSVIFGVGIVVWTWRLASRDGAPESRARFAIFAALLVALNPALLVFSSYHRMYALYAFCIAGMLDSFDARRPHAFVLWASAAFLTFPNAAFYVAALVVLAWSVTSLRPRLLMALGAVVLLGLLYSLPGLLTLKQETAAGNVSRFPVLDLHLFLRFPKFLLGGPFGPMETGLRPLALPLAAVGWLALGGGFLLALRRDRRARLLVGLTILPLLLEALLQPVGVRIYQDKSYLPGAIFLSLLLARVLAAPTGPVARKLALAALVLILAAMAVVDAAWIDSAHPFSMRERRDSVQESLHRAATVAVGDQDTPNLRPLVLADPTFLLGALRYAPISARVRYAPLEGIRSISVPGAYYDFVMTSVAGAGIRVVPAQDLPHPALWIGSPDAVPGVEVLRSPAGFVLTAAP